MDILGKDVNNSANLGMSGSIRRRAEKEFARPGRVLPGHLGLSEVP